MTRETEQTTFLSGSNAIFLEQLYSEYIKNPSAIDPSWVAYFHTLGDEVHQVLKQAVGASWAPRGNFEDTASTTVTTPSVSPLTQLTPEQVNQSTLDALRVQMLVRVYRVRGHLNANLDPLGLSKNTTHPELDPQTYGFTAQDYDRPIFLNGTFNRQSATLREIMDILHSTYCGSVGVEFMHIQEPDQKDWIQDKFENSKPAFSSAQQSVILSNLIKGEDFEKFLSVKYPGAKRFGLEGGESLIPAMEAILEDSVNRGVEEVVLGMSHRGRLNVLVNILGKPARSIFSEFQASTGAVKDFDVQGSGDVKYHLGASNDREINGKKVHLSLTANPSHLEAVDPVVVGKVRAKQNRLKDDTRDKVMGILLHGDAAFAGQGLVAETLCMSELRGYKTGGTLHIIVNNQIGFTTSPHFSRSSPYCSDVVKGIQSPVFHVNGDDPEAVVWVAQLASEFRQKFKKDVVVDLYCYRRHGHNEIDEPAFTQPLMYQVIRNHKTTRTLYQDVLIGQGTLTDTQSQILNEAYNTYLTNEFEVAKKHSQKKADWLEGAWSKFKDMAQQDRYPITGISDKDFKKVQSALTKLPDDFEVHPRLGKLLEAKAQALKTGTDLDWATGEALAFGSLLLQGYPVRLSGQDVGRGTFSQRHAMIYDQKNGAPYVPVNNIDAKQADAEFVDSPLSEASVLGFELGYSLTDPDTLVLWEAQFGDFANGAQVIIDTFLAGGEAKWLRMSGLVMLLPHGYEGQGPEHSSARLERYLQLCGEDNMIVANCSTPANYFHILRRQLLGNTRKPLIIMTPKSLLRHKRAVSTTADFGQGTSFTPIIDDMDTSIKAANVKRLVLCTGKVYYDLLEAREQNKITDCALVRLEQLYPLPEAELKAVFEKYKNAQVFWCQEEPENMGSWLYLDRRLEAVMGQAKMKASRPSYIGRAVAAATATGSASRHEAEQRKLVNEALNIKA